MITNIFDTLEQSPFIFHSVNKEGLILNVSRGWLDLFGYTRPDVIGVEITKFLVDESKDRVVDVTLPKLFKTGETRNEYYRVIKRDGGIIDILVTAITCKEGSDIFSLSFTTDITDQKHTEKNLDKIKQSLANAQRIAHIGNWDWNMKDDEVYWSDEAYMIYHGSRFDRTPTYDIFIDVVHPDDRKFVTDEIKNALNHDSEYNITHRVLLPDETIRVVKAKGEVIFDENNKPFRMIGTVHDITNRRRNEIELEKYRSHLEDLVEERTKEFNETLEMYKTLARISPVGIMRTNVNGECEFVNKKWCDMTGMTKKESKGFGWMCALHPDDAERITIMWDDAVKKRQNWTMDFKLCDVEKNNIWIQCSGNLVNGGSAGHVVTFTNVTKEKRILPELLHLNERIKTDSCAVKNNRRRKNGN